MSPVLCPRESINHSLVALLPTVVIGVCKETWLQGCTSRKGLGSTDLIWCEQLWAEPVSLAHRQVFFDRTGKAQAKAHMLKVSGLSKVQQLSPALLIAALSVFRVFLYDIKASKNRSLDQFLWKKKVSGRYLSLVQYVTKLWHFQSKAFQPPLLICMVNKAKESRSENRRILICYIQLKAGLKQSSKQHRLPRQAGGSHNLSLVTCDVQTTCLRVGLLTVCFRARPLEASTFIPCCAMNTQWK